MVEGESSQPVGQMLGKIFDGLETGYQKKVAKEGLFDVIVKAAILTEEDDSVRAGQLLEAARVKCWDLNKNGQLDIHFARAADFWITIIEGSENGELLKGIQKQRALTLISEEKERLDSEIYTSTGNIGIEDVAKARFVGMIEALQQIGIIDDELDIFFPSSE